MDQNDPIKYAGDYPDLGIITYDHKDPYEAWTDRQNRRNWGEMVRSKYICYLMFFRLCYFLKLL